MRRPFFAFAIFAAACIQPTVAAAPTALRMKSAASVSEYQPFAAPGTASINGQSFLTTRGGDVKLGAGRIVTLDPATSYAFDWFGQIGAVETRFLETPPDSLFRKMRRTTTVDAQGHFRFTQLPRGTYLVRSTVSWETAGGYESHQGGVVADTVTLSDGEMRDFILNHVVEPGAAIAVEFLSKGQVGDRKYTVIRRVSGTSCKRSAYTDPDPSEAVAKDKLVEEATKAGANAVLDIVCEHGGVSFRKNCFSFIECSGDAIRWS